ncbi:hypothetical protein ABHN11_13365 [Brevibacillus centrosporus]|jgi:hypothetical protein|uniref:hypothetical protein n=1 Tax=Brevibacillus centrosporus TaxID=54910 RepID=UPI0039877523
MFTYRNIYSGEIVSSEERLDERKDLIHYPYMGDVVEFTFGPPGMNAYGSKLALMTKNYQKGVVVFLFEDGAILETDMTCSNEDEYIYLTSEQWLQIVKEYRNIHGKDNSYRNIEAFIKEKLNHSFSYEQYAARYNEVLKNNEQVEGIKRMYLDEAHHMFSEIIKDQKDHEAVKSIRKGDTITFEKDGVLQKGTVYAVSRVLKDEIYNVHSKSGKAVIVFKEDLR